MRNSSFVLQFFLRQLALTLPHSVGSWLSEAVALLRLYMLTFFRPYIMILQAISRIDVYDVPKNAQPDISFLADSPHAYVSVRRGSLVPFHPFRKNMSTRDNLRRTVVRTTSGQSITTVNPLCAAINTTVCESL